MLQHAHPVGDNKKRIISLFEQEYYPLYFLFKNNLDIFVWYDIIILLICWYGEIGRRKGLKIPRSNIRTGSSPVTGSA